MKANIHPDYHDIKIVMTDGTEYSTRSTWGKAGDVMTLEIDPKSHPAWTGQTRMLDRGGQLAKFTKRFSGLTGKKDASEGNAEAKEEAKIKLTTTGDKGKKKA